MNEQDDSYDYAEARADLRMAEKDEDFYRPDPMVRPPGRESLGSQLAKLTALVVMGTGLVSAIWFLPW